MNRSRRLLSFLITRGALKRLAFLAVLLALASVWSYFTMIRMPGESYRGPLPPLTESQAALRDQLRRDVEVLAGEIGRRNVFYPTGLVASVRFLEALLIEACSQVRRDEFDFHGQPCFNLEVELAGTSKADEIVVVGAHYDSVGESPAANDNASGVAATLALARTFANSDSPPQRTLRFVLFVNEEPPFFQTDHMGSLVYARRCRERNEDIVAMISLETIGYYSDEPGSQTYPIPLFKWIYPDTGNFIGFVGNYSSRKLVRQAIGTFRNHARFPSEGAALPGWIPGVGWSDHWAFWHAGFPAIMITDTAPFRYPYYHSALDVPERLDYDRMSRVVEGVEKVVNELVNPPQLE